MDDYMKEALILILFLVGSWCQAQVPSYVPTDGLVGFWGFNGNAVDESGNGNDGVVYGATLTTDRNGEVDRAYEFDGATNYIDCGSLGQIPGTVSDITQSAWFLAPTDQSPYCKMSIMSRRQSLGEGWPTIGAGADGGSSFPPVDQAYFFLNASGYITGVQNALYSSDVTTDGNWHFIVGTKSGSTYKMYFDGELQGTYVDDYSLTSNSNLLMGHEAFWGFNCERWFSGKLDEIGIWDRALSEAEVLALFVGCSLSLDTIAGELAPLTLTEYNYNCTNTPNSVYTWEVEGGVITSGQGSNSVSVLWAEEGIGALTVSETNEDGCEGSVTLEVDIICANSATAIDGPLGPSELIEVTYTCNGGPESTYAWSITNGVITSGQGTNTITVIWASTGLASLSVLETTPANCDGDLITLDVVVVLGTSIKEPSSGIINIFPNPTFSELVVERPPPLTIQSCRFFDVNGKMVLEEFLIEPRTTLNIQSLEVGTYILFIHSDQGTLRRKVFIER